MQLDDELVAGIVDVVFPCAFATFVFFSSRPRFAPWAKGVAVLSALCGVTSALLSYILLHHHDFWLSIHTRFVLLGMKHTLDGLVIGVVISVIFSSIRNRIGGGTSET